METKKAMFFFNIPSFHFFESSGENDQGKNFFVFDFFS